MSDQVIAIGRWAQYQKKQALADAAAAFALDKALHELYSVDGDRWSISAVFPNQDLDSRLAKIILTNWKEGELGYSSLSIPVSILSPWAVMKVFDPSRASRRTDYSLVEWRKKQKEAGGTEGLPEDYSDHTEDWFWLQLFYRSGWTLQKVLSYLSGESQLRLAREAKFVD